MFGRVTIRLGIGPHSSSRLYLTDGRGRLLFMSVVFVHLKFSTELNASLITTYDSVGQGNEYWRMANTASAPEGNRLSRKLIRQGFPRAPNDMDAAFVWSGNGRVYFIKGT